MMPVYQKIHHGWYPLSEGSLRHLFAACFARPVLVAILATLASSGAMAADSPLTVYGNPGATLVISRVATPPDPDSEMIDRLRGIAYSGPVGDLAKSLRPARPVDGSFDTAQPWLFWTVSTKKGDKSKITELRRTEAGVILVRDVADVASPKQPTFRLNADTALRHLSTWHTPSPHWISLRDALPPGSSVAWPEPVHPATVAFDRDTLGARLWGGGFTQVEPSKRVLADSRLTVRRPKSDSGFRRYGLLVWINAAYGGTIPTSLEPAADALGLIIIAPNNVPNETPIADRCQHVFDAITTVCESLPIDPDRIYLSGISGGGKTAAILHTCFPELVTGSAPMVGFIGYENVPAENGKTYLGQFRRPRNEIFNILKTQRIAAITGEQDFNRDVTHATARLYQRDKVTVKVWEVPGMGHTVAPDATCTESLSWLDEAAQGKLAALNTKASSPANAPANSDGASRKALIAAAPWSDAAWKACQDLGLLTPPAATPSPK